MAHDVSGLMAEMLTERRERPRVPVIKSAKISLGGGLAPGVFDCLVLDESPAGMLIDLGVVVTLPDEVTVQLAGGASYVARRVWSAGTKAGLEFLGGPVLAGDTALRMRRIAEVLHNQGVLAAVATLRVARHFDSDALREAAEAAEAAYLRLVALLNGRV